MALASNKLKLSASVIANNHRELYDIFSLPLSPDCYIPNERLKNLLNSYKSQAVNDIVSNYECEFQKFPSSHTYSSPEDGSETRITDPVLNKYFTIIQKYLQLPNTSLRFNVKKGRLSIKSYMASNSSKPEYRLEWEDKFILIASKAKSVEASHVVGLIQGMQLGTDGALFLSQFLPTEQVVVPVILCYGNFFHIFGVYLFGDNFPVITALSNPISYLDYEGRLDLARWTVVLTAFAQETIHLLQANNRQQIKTVDSIKLSLNYFFKPILNLGVDSIDEYDDLNNGSLQQSCLNTIMKCYKSLFELDNSQKYFLFPVGVLSYPSQNEDFYKDIKDSLTTFFQQNFKNKFSYMKYGCPILVFPKLDSNWKNTKPSSQFHLSYLTGVAMTIKMMNEARIAHCDLRASNIMWKEEIDETISIQIIDFEDAIPFDIHFKPYESHCYDKRYPFLHQTDPVRITSFHNYWFLVALVDWIKSSDDSFDEFMRKPKYNDIQSKANQITLYASFDPVSYVQNPDQIMNELVNYFESVNLEEKESN